MNDKIALKEIKKAIKQREKYGVKPPHVMMAKDKDGIIFLVEGNTAEEIYKKYIECGYSHM